MKEYVINVEILLEQIRAALERGDPKSATELLEALRPADQAGVFDDLEPSEQDYLIPSLNIESAADIFEEMEDEEAAVHVDGGRSRGAATGKGGQSAGVESR